MEEDREENHEDMGSARVTNNTDQSWVHKVVWGYDTAVGTYYAVGPVGVQRCICVVHKRSKMKKEKTK